MIGTEQAIAAGYAAFKRADYDMARKALNGVAHVQAIHLLGLVEKGAGNYPLAAQYLARAAQLDPGNAEIANNQGLLARLTGDLLMAETAFRRALSLKPGFRSARLSLGRTLTGLDQSQAAMTELAPLIAQNGADIAARVAYATAALEAKDWPGASMHIEAALALEPRNNSARYASGVLALHTGDTAGASEIFTGLLGEGEIADQARYMLARVALAEGNLVTGLDHAEAVYKADQTAVNLVFLADIYWMSGQKTAFDKLVQSALGVPDLALVAIGLMRKAGDEAGALASLDQQCDTLRESFNGQTLRSALLLDLGETRAAVMAGYTAARLNTRVLDHYDLVRALLSAGQAQDALEIIEQARQADPLSQFWLGYEATALRMLGDARYGKLIDYERHVRAYDLPVPEGFATIEAFNAAFLDVLDQMNLFATHPLHQSLRGGGQAPQDLSVNQNPVLQAYFKALHQPIHDYMIALGTSADHPGAARNTGHYKFSGAWSVRLGSGGHHVNHVHPKGWISSAYYVAVPEETRAGQSKAGWIKFGEPPIVTQPVLGPEKWIQPRAGLLVLFPSYLWHGTEPIHDGSVRVTAPFDIVPKEGP